MSRTVGAINKQPADHSDFLDMSVEERLEFIASLIVELMFIDSADYADFIKEFRLNEDL
jgi:hypothetical protein